MHALREYGRVVVYPHPFLDLALDGGEWSTLHLHLGQVLQVPTEQVTGTQNQSGCFDNEEKYLLPGVYLWSLNSSACSLESMQTALP